jgi:hypothetical protein
MRRLLVGIGEVHRQHVRSDSGPHGT